ncbi:hypothetical protein NQ317_009833 [Molorchus minor]|uniref:Kynurenine formamidase n=1 Tax=Molorchus minor TaxID=1323400 RepID=A0ABQ9JBA4_9CUCU|nr:hypothetical protein NQ317_009833 [Molorchus minor]
MSTELTELDILYSPSRWSKRFPGDVVVEKHIELITKCSDEIRNELKSDLYVAYGTGKREVIDIYGTDLDEGGIYLSGHSAGGQLIAALFERFIPSLPQEDQSLFKAAFLLCGIYDLVPLINTKTNILCRLNEQSAKIASPLHMRLSSAVETIFYVVVAEHDSPAFVDSGKKMHEYLLSLGIGSNYVFIKNVDHFDVIEKLIEEDYELTRLIIDVIKKNSL